MERSYRIRDVVKEDFLRFPFALLANPKYTAMSLEAKFVYALLLNRLSLSQKNGWVNEDGEVYLIYTREEVSNTLNISYKKAIAAFKELMEQGLLYEQRQGRGYPNLLYVLKLELSDQEASEFVEDFNQVGRLEEPDVMQENQDQADRSADPAHQDLPKPHALMCKNGTSGPVGMEGLDLPDRQPKRKRLESRKGTRRIFHPSNKEGWRRTRKSWKGFMSNAILASSRKTFKLCSAPPLNGCITQIS